MKTTRVSWSLSSLLDLGGRSSHVLAPLKGWPSPPADSATDPSSAFDPVRLRDAVARALSFAHDRAYFEAAVLQFPGSPRVGLLLQRVNLVTDGRRGCTIQCQSVLAPQAVWSTFLDRHGSFENVSGTTLVCSNGSVEQRIVFDAIVVTAVSCSSTTEAGLVRVGGLIMIGTISDAPETP